MTTEHDRRPDPQAALLASLEQQLHDRIAAATAAGREPRTAPRTAAGMGAGRVR